MPATCRAGCPALIKYNVLHPPFVFFTPRDPPRRALRRTQRLKGRPFSYFSPRPRETALLIATYNTTYASTTPTYEFHVDMSLNTSSRASSPALLTAPRRTRRMSPPSRPRRALPPNSPAGKKAKKSPEGPYLRGHLPSRRGGPLGSGRSPSVARILSMDSISRRRITMAGTSLFTEGYSEAADKIEVDIFFNALAKELTESPLADVSDAFQPALCSSSSSYVSYIYFSSQTDLFLHAVTNLLSPSNPRYLTHSLLPPCFLL